MACVSILSSLKINFQLPEEQSGTSKHARPYSMTIHKALYVFIEVFFFGAFQLFLHLCLYFMSLCELDCTGVEGEKQSGHSH